MAESAECPQCGRRHADEYTHAECPPDSIPEDHRHWVCVNSACGYEWIESVAIASQAGLREAERRT